MTKDRKNSETRRKGAPKNKVHPDPRVLAFVRLLAHRAAERDFAEFVAKEGKAHDTTIKTKGNKP